MGGAIHNAEPAAAGDSLDPVAGEDVSGLKLSHRPDYPPAGQIGAADSRCRQAPSRPGLEWARGSGRNANPDDVGEALASVPAEERRHLLGAPCH